MLRSICLHDFGACVVKIFFFSRRVWLWESKDDITMQPQFPSLLYLWVDGEKSSLPSLLKGTCFYFTFNFTSEVKRLAWLHRHAILSCQKITSHIYDTFLTTGNAVPWGFMIIMLQRFCDVGEWRLTGTGSPRFVYIAWRKSKSLDCLLKLPAAQRFFIIFLFL